jgi:hypothetical protein
MHLACTLNGLRDYLGLERLMGDTMDTQNFRPRSSKQSTPSFQTLISRAEM